MIVELGKASEVTEGLVPGPNVDFVGKPLCMQRNPA